MSPSAGGRGHPGQQVPSPARAQTAAHRGAAAASCFPHGGRGVPVGSLGASSPAVARPTGQPWSLPLQEQVPTQGPRSPRAGCGTALPGSWAGPPPGASPQGCREGTAPRLNGAGAAGGGLKPEPHRGTGTMGNLSPHLQPPLGRTQNVPLRGTCGFQAARPRPLGPPHREPAASRHKGIGGWRCGPLLGSKQIVHWAILFCWKSIWTGSFSFGPAPGQRVKSQLQASLSRPRHVTVYSSSRWFLQI